MEGQIDRLATEILFRLRQSGYDAYAVGGCVRDAVMGLTPHDLDVCTSALPKETERVFQDCRIIPTGEKHGSVTVMTPDGPAEITTFRIDGTYRDHRRPDHVAFVSGVREDLGRRDFTINAMAWSPDTGLFDPFGGQEDLRAGILRCVGEPEVRFREDALRILRALRFASRLEFRIEERTAEAVHGCRALLAEIAEERIFSELKGILVGRGVVPVLLEYSDVIFQILPELAPMYGFDQRSTHHNYDVWEHTVHTVGGIEPDALLRLTMLFHDCGKPESYHPTPSGHGKFVGHPARGVSIADGALRRLRCDRRTRETILTLILHHDEALPRGRAGMGALLREFGEDTVRKLIEIQTADTKAKAPSEMDAVLAGIRASEGVLNAVVADGCWSFAQLAVGGRELLAAGIPEGPGVGELLNQLLTGVIAGELPNERETLLREALRETERPQGPIGENVP